MQQQFADDPEAERVDLEYFQAIDRGDRSRIARRSICACRDCARLRRTNSIRSNTRSCGWGCMNWKSRPELPYRVALAEAVQLTKQFGATDGHKFVNAVLDRAAQESRPHEYGRRRGSDEPGSRSRTNSN